MAKKKKNRKQRKLQRQQSGVTTAVRSPSISRNDEADKKSATPISPVKKDSGTTKSNTSEGQKTSTPMAQSQEFRYVGRELRHSLFFVIGIMIAYIIIWFGLAHTGLGAALAHWLHL